MASTLKLKILLKNNKVIIENYFFMTLLQVLNSMFYLIVYPFLIRTLGAASYGLYVFSISIVTYFISIVCFGFDMPAVKMIALYPNDYEKKSYTISCVFTAKVLLEIVSLVVFLVLVISIPYLRTNWILLSICFLQTLTNILFPQWYFQGVQRMRTVTLIQLAFKILSLPFILLTLHNSNDIVLFSIITTLTSIGGGIVASIILRFREKIKIKWMKFSEVKKWYIDAFPFFLSSSAGIIKEQSVAIIIGSFFGMKDVAIYDLATKIIGIPRILLTSVNGALFPKIMANYRNNIVKKIIHYQTAVGVLLIIIIVLFGKWAVLLLGGKTMSDSYPVTIILSVTIATWMIVGSYISFVFVPNGRFYLVTKNQIVAVISYFIYCGLGLIFFQNAYILATALSLSGLTEIVFCRYLIKKEILL
jgi:PST family polysaccharide transporter